MRRGKRQTGSLPPPLEREIQQQVIDYLLLRRFRVLRQNTGALRIGRRLVRFGQPGSADLLVILPALPDLPRAGLAAVEIKRPGNRPTVLQRAWLDDMTSEGVCCWVVSSVDEVRRELSLAGYPEGN